MRNIFVAIFFIFTTTVFAQIPNKAEYVSDEGKILSQSQKKDIEYRLSKLQKTFDHKPQMSVVIAKSLKNDSIEEYAVKVFRKFKIGQKAYDNGILLVIAPNEHKSRIEVGYGFEGYITDIQTADILENIKPLLSDKKYNDAIVATIDKMTVLIPKEMSKKVETKENYTWFLFLLFPLLGIGIYYMIKKRRVAVSVVERKTNRPVYSTTVIKDTPRPYENKTESTSDGFVSGFITAQIVDSIASVISSVAESVADSFSGGGGDSGGGGGSSDF